MSALETITETIRSFENYSRPNLLRELIVDQDFMDRLQFDLQKMQRIPEPLGSVQDIQIRGVRVRV